MKMVEARGLEPRYPVCRTGALPLSYAPVARGGFEPSTPGFSDPRSTPELPRRDWSGQAGSNCRSLVGNEVLYH